MIKRAEHIWRPCCLHYFTSSMIGSMSFILRKICFATIALWFLHLCTSCKGNSPAIDNANDLITAYYTSIGGYENLKSIETKILEGHYIEPGYDLLIKAHMEYKRPYYRIIGDTLSGFMEGYDGNSWEFSRAKATIVPMARQPRQPNGERNLICPL